MSLYPKMEVLSERLPPVEALDGDELVFVLDDPAGSPTPKVATTQQIADLGGGGGGECLEYVAILNNGAEPTDPPAVTVIKNTLGQDLNWSRLFTGYYAGMAGSTPPFPFDPAKTVFFVGNLSPTYLYKLDCGAENAVTLQAYDASSWPPVNGDNLLFGVPIEIRVYP